MQDYILSISGIIVSIILYLLGYRQTIGAKKERIRTANKDVEKILIRRIVNESYQLSLTDIVRLLKGKARDFKVKVGDLYSEEQILNSIFTRVIESDFINQEQREEVLTKLFPIIEEHNSTIEFDYYIDKVKDNYVSRVPLTIFLTFMALLASIIGGFFTILPILKSSTLTKDFNTLIVTISGSLLAIISISLFRKFKESQQEVTLSDSSQRIQSAIQFEKAVGNLISKKNYDIQPSKINEGYDFLVNNKDGKILIEVKAWGDRVPISLIEKTVVRLKNAVEIQEAKEGIIVIQNPIKNLERFSKEKEIKILTKRELNKYL